MSGLVLMSTSVESVGRTPGAGRFSLFPVRARLDRFGSSVHRSVDVRFWAVGRPFILSWTELERGDDHLSVTVHWPSCCPEFVSREVVRRAGWDEFSTCVAVRL